MNFFSPPPLQMHDCHCTSCRSSDGRILVMSSTDGYCSLVSFAEGELGTQYVETDSSKAAKRVNREEAEIEEKSKISPSNMEENIKSCSNSPDKPSEKQRDEESKKPSSITPEESSTKQEEKESKEPSSDTLEKSLNKQQEESRKSSSTPEGAPKKLVTVRRAGDRYVKSLKTWRYH